MAFTATREEGGELGHRGVPPQLHCGDPREERGSRRGGGRRAWASRAPPPALLAAAGGTSTHCRRPLLAWLACPCVEAARGHGGAEAAAPELPPGRIRAPPSPFPLARATAGARRLVRATDRGGLRTAAAPCSWRRARHARPAAGGEDLLRGSHGEARRPPPPSPSGGLRAPPLPPVAMAARHGGLGGAARWTWPPDPGARRRPWPPPFFYATG